MVSTRAFASMAMSAHRSAWHRRGLASRAAGRRAGTVIVLIAGAISLTLVTSARAQQQQFDISPCSNNPQRMIYVAVGRHVYRQPAENLRYVHGISLETAADLPIPPRRSEPEGCPDHPLRGIGFKFGPFSDVGSPGESPGVTETRIGGPIQLIEIDPHSWWDTHERYALAGAGVCRAGDRSDHETAPGMTICRPNPARAAEDPARSSFAAIIDSRFYSGPLNQPLAILCNADDSSRGDDHVCEISYRLDRSVGVWYQFSTSLISLPRIIAFDRELRRRIAQAEITDYSWPVVPFGRRSASR
jgi:hypothetical protein